MFARIALCCLLAGLAACVAVEPRLTSESIFYIDAYVKRQPPAVYIQPTAAPGRPLTAMIIPFAVTQNIPGARDLGTQVTQIFWQGLNQLGTFPTLIYETGLEFKSPEEIMLIARDRRVDLIMNGNITHLLAGGTQGDTMVAVNLQVLDVATGKRIWHMAQAGRMEPGMTHDFILAMTKNRMPTDPIYAIVMCLAEDMGTLMKNWNFNLLDKQGRPARKQPAQGGSDKSQLGDR